MIRTQVQFNEDQAEALKILAARNQVSVAEVVRNAVDLLVQSQREPPPAELRRRAIAAAGRYSSDRHDVSEAHDEYLAEAYQS